MRGIFVVLVAGALGFGAVQIASAADMPVKAPIVKAPIAAPVYDWTGLYVGGVLGYGWGKGIHCDASPTTVCDPETDPKGWNAGITLGYNWQWANWVVGLEGDWSWANLHAASPTTTLFGCGAAAGVDGCFTKIKSFETARARVGWAFDRFLPYVTAGAAWTQLQASIGTPNIVSNTTTKTSFVVGGGVEYAVWQNLSAKLEYLYISQLGDFAYDTVGTCGTPGCFVHVGAINVVRVGANWRFKGL